MSARKTSLVLCLINLIACSTGELIELEVDHYQIPCLEERLHLCMLTREDEKQAWDRFFDTIEDWKPVWGERARLAVLKREKLDAYGGTSDFYKLEDEISVEPVEPGTTFTYPFRPNEQDPDLPMLKRITNTLSGTLADGRQFNCADESVCQTIDDSLGASATLVLDIAYADPIDGPLIVQSALLQP